MQGAIGDLRHIALSSRLHMPPPVRRPLQTIHPDTPVLAFKRRPVWSAQEALNRWGGWRLTHQGRHPTLVFPSPRDQVPLTDMALTSLLRRTNAHSDVEGRTATAHGFRSSFRDWCSEHGYARDLAERALAHTVQNKVEAAYHRTDLLEKRRPMMEAWGQHVLSMTVQR